MHSVIKNILARRGKAVPVNDGRSIALVLYGGLMTGVRGAAALLALQEMGLANAFDKIYAVSSGFPNASYLLSGNGRAGISIYFEELASRKFINFFRLTKIVDVDYAVSVVRDDKNKSINLDKILSSKTMVFVRVRDKIRGPEYFEVHKEVNSLGPQSYFQLMRATCAFPIFYPHSVLIDGNLYRDGESKWNDPFAHYGYCLKHSEATDILVICNNTNQKIQDKDVPGNVYEICPKPDWKLGHFETSTPKLKQAAQQMGDLVKKEFGDDRPVQLDYGDEVI